LSNKHKNNEIHFKNKENKVNKENNSFDSTRRKYSCNICEKQFNDIGGLSRHKKKCKINNFNTNDITDKELIVMLIKQNTELMKETQQQNKETTNFKTMMMEQQNLILEFVKNGTHNTNTNTNSHNKTFNLQFFLNETCKDAMNIMDFADSIQLQLSDLENVGKKGFVEGISNIITSNLKALISKRPVHCADKKREIMYVKDENMWQKENDNNPKIRKAIKRVISKNQRLMPKFKEAHPDCLKSSSLFSDQYNKILVESMGGSGNNDLEKEDKIIRNIYKIVTIDKEP
jgi:hypothetical protein